MLTSAEKATNSDTWTHIDLVSRLLAKVQLEIIKRSLTHDRSKLLPPEVSAFTKFTANLAESTYGSEEYKETLLQMRPALDHHYSKNRHHPEHFDNGVDGMNLVDLLEMIVDWMAATKRHNDGDIERSIEINTDRFGLSPQVVAILKNTVRLLEVHGPLDSLSTQENL